MKNQSMISNRFKNMYSAVEYDLSPYIALVGQINAIRLETLTTEELRLRFLRLKQQVRQGVSLDCLLPEAFALVKEAAYRVLSLRPFDVQLIAAAALHHGKIIEMQTGEGKTLTAVLPAYLSALTGKGVHILTFNDYLAGRDAGWMGPLYELLGLTVGHIKETMSMEERQRAYQADVTYVTAKEAGFDYLRDFLCTDKSTLIHRKFHHAIIDEADSILIDEARIPLVIASSLPQNVEAYVSLSSLVRGFSAGRDYAIDQYEGTVYLTEVGLHRAETELGCNLYENRNLDLLAKLNCALHAEVLLKKDRDYIVRNGKIEIVDEFTGRIADKRHWPDNLHAAVEAKEGVLSFSKGIIMGSVALQYFISLYPKLCGMTGTARTAAAELQEFYGLEVVAVPTNKPCIRRDHEDNIYATRSEKYEAVVSEVARAHGKGQPVLLGTGCVQESELLAEMLAGAGIHCRVLNAKNDQEEAEIIARAGELGAVTVSTNMAGRGVDIKLGGIDESQRDKVAELGGLYVIGTNRHESRRVDNQLRGRSGRQGDPGESRLFISLEDEWIKKYEILKGLPKGYLEENCKELKEDRTIRNLIARGQRIVEGYNSDIRRQLWKYSYILEQQRRIIHHWRQDILTDQITLGLLSEQSPKRWQDLESRYGKALLERVEKQLALYHINKHWSEYLDYISYVRESIHLVVIGGMNPLFEYNRLAVQAFSEMQQNLLRDITKAFEAADITEEGIDMEGEGMRTPSATWTYLINDNPDQFSNLGNIIKAVTNAIKGPLFTLRSIFKTLSKRILKAKSK